MKKLLTVFLFSVIAFAQGPTPPPNVGAAGVNAYTTTGATFTQPNVSSTVSVTVANTSWMATDQVLYIAGGGYYQVASITNGTHVVLTNLGYFGNAAPAASITTPKAVSPGGISGEVSGTGTTNKVTKFTAAAVIGDSQISDTGSLITIPGITDLSTATLKGGSPLVFDGATANANVTTVVVTDPTGARQFTIPNANSVAIQPDTGASNNFLTAVSALGVISKAQPAFTNISGVATGAQGTLGIATPAAILASAMGAQSSATPANVTNMTWTIAASKNYELDCHLPITLAAAATIAFDLNGPGTPTSYSLSADGAIGTAGVWAQISTLAAGAWGTATGASSAAANTSVIHVHAGIQNGSTASGTALTLRTIADGTHNITVLANGTCLLAQVN